VVLFGAEPLGRRPETASRGGRRAANHRQQTVNLLLIVHHLGERPSESHRLGGQFAAAAGALVEIR